MTLNSINVKENGHRPLLSVFPYFIWEERRPMNSSCDKGNSYTAMFEEK
jgi:hypothetical protein